MHTPPSPPAHRHQHLALIVFAALVTACPATPAPDASEASEASEASAPPPARSQAPPVHLGPEFTLAGADGDVIELVNAERARAQADDRLLVVYVGASWCEPCQYFHDAVEGGALDRDFPRLRLLEFDLDRDRDRLAAAGYSSRMIPLFVVPAPDGRAGPRRTEGGIKGPAGVDNLRPRLEALLVAAQADQN